LIKCNHCGNMTPAGAACQSCGAPLAIRIDDGLSPRMGAQEQPELPAWLESLRAGERSAPATNTNSSANFSTADFIEQGSLPSWMRAERNNSPESSASHAPISSFSPSFSDPNSGNGTFPSAGLAAQSLIDEKSLPSWMQDGKSSTPSSPSNSSATFPLQEEKQSLSSSPNNFSASSLIQQDNVPDWMKTLQQPGPGEAAPISSPRSEQPAKPSVPSGQTSSPLASGLSGRDLIDQQSLPAWMQAANSQDKGTASSFSQETAASAPTAPAAGAGSLGFSASSLLDMSSLPQWLKEGGQAASANPTAGANTSSTGWPLAPSSQPLASASATGSKPQQEGGPLSASSFIDTNSLPAWLRTASDQPQQVGGQRPASSPIPPRVDNMRVPSRPRGEVNSTESSELAAHVFASMLGVASATPNYPASQQPAAPNYPAPQQSAGSNYPAAQQVSGNQMQQASNAGYPQPGQLNQGGQSANSYGQLNQPGQLGPSSLSNIPNPGAVPNTPSQMGGMYSQGYGMNSGSNGSSMSGGYSGNYTSNNSGQGNPSMSGNLSMGGNPSFNGMSQYPGNAGSMATPASQVQIPGMAEDQRNNKKRGIFEAIRDWLSR
jgi:hypothetical protein